MDQNKNSYISRSMVDMEFNPLLDKDIVSIQTKIDEIKKEISAD